MAGFREGYQFFTDHAAEFTGVISGVEYIDSVNGEINAFLENIAKFKGDNTPVSQMKGDLAEFWHAGTFNINAAVKGSTHRANVDRSTEFASVDVSSNFGGNFGLKYYKSGVESAKQQSKSVFETFSKYKVNGGEETLEEYLSNRGFQDDSVLNDPVYIGQFRVIPSDQMKSAVEWLEKKIEKERTIRPEQARRYQDTLNMLRDRVSDEKGVESIPLTEADARKLAQLAKEDNVDPEEWGLTTEELIHYEDILRQSFKAGLTAATISLVLKAAPEIINAVKYLIENGEVDGEQFKQIGFAALSGSSEGFIRGTISASITASCQAGLLGAALKSIDPSIIGAVTVFTMDSVKNSYQVACGRMTRHEMTNELIRSMFTSTCALVFGSVSQSFIEIPVFGYMIGSFVGSMAGSFIYSAAYHPVISFCTDTGFTAFGLVEQDYKLPEDLMKEIGMDVFEYESFEYNGFEPKQFEFNSFRANTFEPAKIDMTFLRRGVIGVNAVGFLRLSESV